MENINNYSMYTLIKELKDEALDTTFGKSSSLFEIFKFTDVTNLNSKDAYIITMKQRVTIPNDTPYTAGLVTSTQYNDYPVILLNNVKIETNVKANIQLKNMFPKTLNSAVTKSSNSSNASSNSMTNEHSTGSSNTNVNTFGVNVGGGFIGPAPVFNIGADYSHTWENSKSNSNSNSNTTDASHTRAENDTMSIKDWSSYGSLNEDGISPSWIWGQTYPWDVIEFNQSKDGTYIELPSFVQERLMSADKDNPIILPPSQLSQFGIDFIMQTSWIITFDEEFSEDETITISIDTSCYKASHKIANDKILASLDKEENALNDQFQTEEINLSKYALKPIVSPSLAPSAIAFTANNFTYPPKNNETPFKIVSPANNLQLTGIGFDDILTTTFKTKVSLTLNFKISNTTADYSLMLMNWIDQESAPCVLNCNINNNWKSSIHVDTPQGQGGQNNISTIELRNTSFSSINFHDYLIIGENEVTIEIIPTDDSKNNKYTLFAISVEEG